MCRLVRVLEGPRAPHAGTVWDGGAPSSPPVPAPPPPAPAGPQGRRPSAWPCPAPHRTQGPPGRLLRQRVCGGAGRCGGARCCLGAAGGVRQVGSLEEGASSSSSSSIYGQGLLLQWGARLPLPHAPGAQALRHLPCDSPPLRLTALATPCDPCAPWYRSDSAGAAGGGAANWLTDAGAGSMKGGDRGAKAPQTKASADPFPKSRWTSKPGDLHWHPRMACAGATTAHWLSPPVLPSVPPLVVLHRTTRSTTAAWRARR